MKWAWLDYGLGWARCACHPHAAKRRIADVAARYDGKLPDKRESVEQVHVDFGGCVFAREVPDTIILAPNRRLTVFRHHMGHLAQKIEDREPVNGYIRFGGWLGVLFYISAVDRRKILAAINAAAVTETELVEKAEKINAIVEASPFLGKRPPTPVNDVP
jgi:hypothetical protein